MAIGRPGGMAAPGLLLAALAAGATHPLAWGLDLAPAWMIGWKGAGVGLLALWASRQGQSLDHRLLVAVLTLGAIADMLLEIALMAGAAVFALGHVVAIWLYRRHARRGRGWLAPAALLVGGLAIVSAWLAGPAMAAPVAAYALVLGAMTAAALASRFALAAAGALLFLVADLMIFARMGPLAGVPAVGLGIWWLYFAGQAMIALGVARGLDAGRPAV